MQNLPFRLKKDKPSCSRATAHGPTLHKTCIETLEPKRCLSNLIFGPPSLEQVTALQESAMVSSLQIDGRQIAFTSISDAIVAYREELVRVAETDTNAYLDADRPMTTVFFSKNFQDNTDEYDVPAPQALDLSASSLSTNDLTPQTSGSSSSGFSLTVEYDNALTVDGVHYLVERNSAPNEDYADAFLETASYAKIVAPAIPTPHAGQIVFSGSATFNLDYEVRVEAAGEIVPLWSDSATYAYSGGSSTFYIIPRNDYAVEELETVVASLYQIDLSPSGGSGSSGGQSTCLASLNVLIADDDIEFISDSDRGPDGALSQNPIRNVDAYQAYLFVNQYVIDGSPTGDVCCVTPIDALVGNDCLFGSASYMIVSGNTEGFFTIDSETGVISLSSDAELELIPETTVLTILTSFNENISSPDLATVTVTKVIPEITPYTPRTKYFAPMALPAETWLDVGVGIRQNTDYDQSAQDPEVPRDYLYDGFSFMDDDLIRLDVTDISEGAAYGLMFELERSSDALKVWRSEYKNYTECTFVDGKHLLSGEDTTFWTEYASTERNDVACSIVVRNKFNGAEFYRQEVPFRLFENMTSVFVGEFESPGLPEESPGLNDMVVDLLKKGYNVHVWDDGFDLFDDESVIDCDSDGSGHARSEIVNEVNYQGISELAFIGYSHGGGSVYNLSANLFGSNDIPFDFSCSLVFTAYIDAVKNSWSGSISAENRRPVGSETHVNVYQTNGLVHGCSIAVVGDDDQNWNITSDSLSHGHSSSGSGNSEEDCHSIDEDEWTHSIIFESYKEHCLG